MENTDYKIFYSENKHKMSFFFRRRNTYTKVSQIQTDEPSEYIYIEAYKQPLKQPFGKSKDVSGIIEPIKSIVKKEFPELSNNGIRSKEMIILDLIDKSNYFYTFNFYLFIKYGDVKKNILWHAIRNFESYYGKGQILTAPLIEISQSKLIVITKQLMYIYLILYFIIQAYKNKPNQNNIDVEENIIFLPVKRLSYQEIDEIIDDLFTKSNFIQPINTSEIAEDIRKDVISKQLSLGKMLVNMNAKTQLSEDTFKNILQRKEKEDDYYIQYYYF